MKKLAFAITLICLSSMAVFTLAITYPLHLKIVSDTVQALYKL